MCGVASRKPFPVESVVLEGAHMLYSVNQDKARAHYSQWGTLKGTTGSDNTLAEYRAANPNGVTVYRSLHNAIYGQADCMPKHASISTWMSGLEPFWYDKKGYVDLYEFENECGFSPEEQIYANIGAMEWANERGYCLLLFSFNPGVPELADWKIMAPPVLDYALAHPCGTWPDGRTKYHEVAMHYYSITSQTGDYWLFQRYQWLYRALPEKYRTIGVWFTEFGSDWGGLPLDCAKLRELVLYARDYYANDPLHVVRGYHIWSLGDSPIWANAENCKLWGDP